MYKINYVSLFNVFKSLIISRNFILQKIIIHFKLKFKSNKTKMYLFIDYLIRQRSPTSLKARERQQNGGLCYCSMEYIRPLRLCRIVLTPQVSDCF